MDFARVYKQYMVMADAALDELVPPAPRSDSHEDILAQCMRYAVSGGGKRLRPVLTIASCDIVGGNVDNAVVPAAAIELIHTYSLIHDDLPCMDDDDMRRDKPTAHKVFGEAMALLAGDALLTYAFEVLSRAVLPPETQLRLVHEVAEAAGSRGMVLGQVLDTFYSATMTGENPTMTEESPTSEAHLTGAKQGWDQTLWQQRLERMHALKTGKLLTVSARLGAWCGGCTPAQLDLLTQYAEKVGLAFQIQDDLLDEVGDSGSMGKNTGSDSRLGKLTYVSLLGVEEAVRQRDKALAEAGRVLVPFGNKAEFLLALADYIASRER